MTCIAVAADERGLWAASDRGVNSSRGGETFRNSRSHEPKVVVHSGYLLGVTGYSRVGQLVRYLELPGAPRGSRGAVDRFMAVDFVAALRKGLGELADGGYLLVVGVAGRWIYEVDSSGHVLRMGDGYDAVGVAEYALGSLFTSRSLNGYNGRLRVVRALEAAMHHDGTLLGPIDVVHQPRAA